ncbi:MAG TPA: 3'-5' exonuclease [Anaerolineaceae bacterium]|nr:3'-5' exonuclease [Anaerolineaceae bacterium]
MTEEVFICVDVETAGPVPGRYAMLSIGACLVYNIAVNFYMELKPDKTEYDPGALAISGLEMDELHRKGTEPAEVMRAFAGWINGVAPAPARPVFVAFNAPFDWMFVNEYFHRYLGENPFGHSALDIKAYFMGQMGVNWADTSMQRISSFFLEERHLTHNALKDAQDQAEVFLKILKANPKFNVTE